ncbi:MAG: hypothetical protein GXO26_03215 [Crenarchaeota archaeon]|nr:hypothetical protein [Thermoproteota archaeon]
MTITDIYAVETGTGYKIKLLGRGGEVVASYIHQPWMLGITRYRRIPRVKGIIKAELTPYVPIVYDKSLMTYAPIDANVFKIYALRKEKIPEIASSLKKFNVMPTQHNIIYLVRSAMDIVKQLFGTPVPLVLRKNEEMVSTARKLVDFFGDIKVLVFDIEVYSRRGGFPQRGDPIITIQYAVFKLKDNVFTKDFVKKIKVLWAEKLDFKSSRKLAEKFLEIIREEQPDYVISYNGAEFDLLYLQPFAPPDTITPFYIMPDGPTGRIIPHIDLMMVRDNLKSSLGIRSTVAKALDDVAVEVIKEVSKIVPEAKWVLDSEYLEAERVLNHAKLKEYYDNKHPLLEKYVVADVLLTSIIARVWLYILFMLSVMYGIPPSVFQRLSPGQVNEYLLVNILNKIGIAPVYRKKELEYRKACDIYCIRDLSKAPEAFQEGKTYTKTYGVFNNVLEGDYAQLYPSDMTSNAADFMNLHIIDKIVFNNEGRIVDRIRNKLNLRIKERASEVILGKKRSKSKDCMDILVYVTLVSGYGILSFLIYKIYNARRMTKKFKKEAKKTGRVELLALDKAVKILANSLYGLFGKMSGNIINELFSAMVFWRTQMIKHDTIEIANRIAKEMGNCGEVIYADTDSIFMHWKCTDEQFFELLDRVTKEIQRKYGKYYFIEYEDKFSKCVFPKQKYSDEPSAKSYICYDTEGRVSVIKGEFYKATVPLALKERLTEFYDKVITRKLSSKKEIAELIDEILQDAPYNRLFIKKSISSFVNEDDPSKVKRINKTFHYAALFTSYIYSNEGVYAPKPTSNGILSYLGEKDEWKRVDVEIDARKVLAKQRSIITYFLPDPNPDKKSSFYVYLDDDGKICKVARVIASKPTIVKRPDGYEKGYKIHFSYKIIEMRRDEIIDLIKRALLDKFIDDVYHKLVPALSREY